MGSTAYDPSSGVVSLPAYPTALKNPKSMTIKAGTDTVSSYDGSASKTFTVAASTTAGAFTISDGTTTKTVQLAGKFTDNNTTYSAGTGLQLSGTTFSAKLNSTTSLGTIGSTSKLYAVGVDANGKLCVNVPWTDTNTDTHYTNYLQIKGDGTEAVKFTQNADKSLNLKPSGSVSISAASDEITISATDTKNTAGAKNYAGKLYLIGAKEQTDNPQTYSYNGVYMESGTLTALSLSTSIMELPDSSLDLRFGSGKDMASGVARFNYSSLGGADLSMTGHLVLNEAGAHPDKPENKTGLNYMSCADYFDTGIALIGKRTSSDLPSIIKLSFPGKSGTLATLDDTKIEIVDLTL